MRIDRLAIAAAALVASTVLISCGSDNNSTPSNNTVGLSGSLPAADTTPLATTPLVVDTTTP
jgi:hypothetical protein